MKAFLLSGVALVALGAGALAADLIEPHVIRANLPPLPPPIPVAIYNWTGIYGGVNAGYGFKVEEDSGIARRLRGTGIDGAVVTVTREPRGAFLRDSDDGGVLGGGQVGYNLQFGTFVAGVEADMQVVDTGERGGFRSLDGGFGTASVGGPGTGLAPRQPGERGNVAFFNDRGLNGLDHFGTVRARFGMAWDNILVYGTGGLAWTLADDETRGSFRNGAEIVTRNPGFFVGGAGGNAALRASAIRPTTEERSGIGYAVGGGMEYAFSQSLSAKLEGLYVDLSSDERKSRVVGVTNTGARIRQAGSQHDTEFGIIRTGLNYRFGTW